jgi:copper transport protein
VLRDAGLAGLVVLAVALAWLVLVVLRRPEPLVAGDRLVLRVDTGVADSLRADRIAAFGTWIVNLTTTLVLGGVIFRTVISKGAGRAVGWSPARIVRGAAILGAAASLAVLPFRAAALAGTGRVAVVDTATLDFVATSRFGTAALLRIAGLFVAAFGVVGPAVAHRHDRSRRSSGSRRSAAPAGEGSAANHLVGALGVGLLLASYAWIGHPQATAAPGPLLVVSQAVHVLAVSTWFAGVVLLYLQIRAGRRAGAIRASAEVVARFSTAAGVSVLLAAVTGIVLARSQVASLDALTTGHYGRALILKLVLVAVVLAIGGYNKEFVVPRIVEQGGPAAWRRLHRTLLAEAAVLAGGVLLATTAMISGGI